MDIISYLLEILQLRKEVGITDLGTFYKKKSPGRYDKEKQSFLPPSYSLQFTSELKEDEALANFISAKRNISVDSANYYISQFADDIKQKLEVEHEAELENFGRLFFTEHAGLSFEPIENISYGSEFYGLPSLQETVTDDDTTNANDEQQVFEEISEAPTAPIVPESTDLEPPIIENIELDEVKDDLKHTLKHSPQGTEEIIEAPEFIKEQHEEHPNRFGHTPESETLANENNQETDEEIIEAPEFIKEQHEEHPNRFGHTPESETLEQDTTNDNEAPEPPIIENIELDEVKDDLKNTLKHSTPPAEEEITDAPEFIKEQHEEHPNRFGHTPESETLANNINEEIASKKEDEPKTYLNLEDDKVEAEQIIEAPEFIKEQHAEHPNRFGHDPMMDEPAQTEGKSTWLKIVALIIILAIIGVVVYFLKPELFNQQPKVVTTPLAVIDSPKVSIDTAKARQDSIAKTDSILKANQVGAMIDTSNHVTPTPVAKEKAVKAKNITFDVIAASYETDKGAQRYINGVRKLGINAKVAKMPGPRKNISIGSFKTQEEAVKQRDILQKKLKGKGFYVQQINNNTQP